MAITVNPRIYGSSPYHIAVIHGGPGAPGGMAPVARELSLLQGVLEPLQTSNSVTGQIEELFGQLELSADLPVTLIGHSWGAMLAFLFAAAHPRMVRKLILVASGPLEGHYAEGIMDTRISRLSEEERQEIQSILQSLENPERRDNAQLLKRFGELCAKADTYDPIVIEDEVMEVQLDVYKSVWSEAEWLRAKGYFFERGKLIQCPVTAIHGDYDPHPYQGVQDPLVQTVRDFQFILLPNCGHSPWNERETRERFYQILNDEIHF